MNCRFMANYISSSAFNAIGFAAVSSSLFVPHSTDIQCQIAIKVSDTDGTIPAYAAPRAVKCFRTAPSRRYHSLIIRDGPN